jgi:hypothetical protein
MPFIRSPSEAHPGKTPSHDPQAPSSAPDDLSCAPMTWDNSSITHVLRHQSGSSLLANAITIGHRRPEVRKRRDTVAAPGNGSHAAWAPPTISFKELSAAVPTMLNRRESTGELRWGRNHYGGTRGMPEPHTLARPEAYRRGARSVKIWGGHGPVAGRRAHRTIPRQLCDDGPHTARVDSIKLTNTGVRPELANLQMPGHAHRFDMPSAELRRCNALGLTNIVGGGSFATRVVALATDPGWSGCSHRQLGNDRGGKQ